MGVESSVECESNGSRMISRMGVESLVTELLMISIPPTSFWNDQQNGSRILLVEWGSNHQ